MADTLKGYLDGLVEELGGTNEIIITAQSIVAARELAKEVDHGFRAVRWLHWAIARVDDGNDYSALLDFTAKQAYENQERLKRSISSIAEYITNKAVTAYYPRVIIDRDLNINLLVRKERGKTYVQARSGDLVVGTEVEL